MVVLAAALAGFVGAVIGSSVSVSIKVRRISGAEQKDRMDSGQEALSCATADCEIDALCCEDKSVAENRPEDRLEDFRRWLEEQERAAKLRAVDGGNVLPEQRDLSAVALQDPSEDLLRGGLPGAVGPQETEEDRKSVV